MTNSSFNAENKLQSIANTRRRISNSLKRVALTSGGMSAALMGGVYEASLISGMDGIKANAIAHQAVVGFETRVLHAALGFLCVALIFGAGAICLNSSADNLLPPQPY